MSDSFDPFSYEENSYWNTDLANGPAWQSPAGITGINNIDALVNAMQSGMVSDEQARAVLAGNKTIELGNSFNLKKATLLTSTDIDPYVFAFQNHLGLNYPVRFWDTGRPDQNATTGRVVLPVTPETFEVSGDNSPEDSVSITGQTFSHAGPVGLRTITMEGFFPQLPTGSVHTQAGEEGSVDSMPDYVNAWAAPKGYLYQPETLSRKFETARDAGQPLLFHIYKLNQNKSSVLTMPVVITNYSWSIKHANGEDHFWSMTLREWQPQLLRIGGLKTNAAAKGTSRGGGVGAGTAPPTAAPTASSSSKYTIKSGDTLKKIADKQMGSATKWQELYKANLDILNKALKAHGQKLNNPDLVYAGTVIRIP